MSVAVDRVLLSDVKLLLRDALKVGPEMEIADDMPLIGGPIDIDSIDILLVISTIEKKFGMKIPNEAVGRAAFTDVWTLAKYVQDNRELLKTAPAVAGQLSPADWLGRLPHGPEFRFVSELREVDPGNAAVGYWHVKGDEAFLAGHFPGRPIVPGVLLTEALAQVAGIAGAREGNRSGMLAAVDVRFLAPIEPPASIELRARVDADGRCEVIASVGGMPVAQGWVTIHFG